MSCHAEPPQDATRGPQAPEGAAPHLAFTLVLGAVMAADATTRLFLGGDPRRVISNWAVMVASGSCSTIEWNLIAAIVFKRVFYAQFI